ncbi:MAG TPA: homoserine kinase [Vicinamibacterales bacterium]|nr:homoserine kinase [Vicinamibacterales bacterium]
MSLKTSSTTLGSEVKVPGSVANLGGGFDTLGVAIQLFLRATIVDIQDDGGAKLVVAKSVPAVRSRNQLERAFEVIAKRTRRHAPTVFVEVSSEIPMAAGLGSSGAATVAGLRVFERVTGAIPDSVLLAAATEVEGHADNAAPSLFGGLNSVVEGQDSEPLALRWTWPDDLRLVVSTPAIGLATAKARAALPDTMPRPDAIFNLQRVLSLVHALQHRQYERIREGVKDRWHQPARAALVPLLGEVLAVDDPDVLGAFLSGAGPSVATIARAEAAPRVERLLASMYARAGIETTVRVLAAHEGASSAEPESSNRVADAAASARGRAV